MFWGDRMARTSDPYGNEWTVRDTCFLQPVVYFSGIVASLVHDSKHRAPKFQLVALMCLMRTCQLLYSNLWTGSNRSCWRTIQTRCGDQWVGVQLSTVVNKHVTEEDMKKGMEEMVCMAKRGRDGDGTDTDSDTKAAKTDE